MFKLIGLDVDGTILSQHQIHPLTHKAIQQAQSLKMHVVLASGRNLKRLQKIATQLQINRPGNYLVCQNGAQVYQWINQHQLQMCYSNTMDLFITNKIVDLANQYQILLFIFGEQENIIYSNQTTSDFHQYMRSYGEQITFVQSGKQIIDAIKFECFATKIQMTQFADAIKALNLPFFANTSSLSHLTEAFMEIVPPNTDKLNGLKLVCEQMRITPKQVLYFGDGENDVRTLTWAGQGVAMQNANLQIRKTADSVTNLSVNHGGVGDFLFKHILK